MPSGMRLMPWRVSKMDTFSTGVIILVGLLVSLLVLTVGYHAALDAREAARGWGE